MDILSLEQFKSASGAQFSKGTWIIEYHDRTHLRKDNYLPLGEIDIEECKPGQECLFWFYPRCRKKLKESITDKWKNEDGKGEESIAAGIILDQLSESMVRLGLMKPDFEISDYESFNKRTSAVIVLDTNALRDGAVRHLKEQFPEIQMWFVIPTVSLMEIGEKVANLSSRDREGFKKNNNIIRGRPQVTIAPQELKYIRDNFPTETLELAPELLRTFSGYEKKDKSAGKEAERISINDRLILEGIKDLRRQRNLSDGVYLMSADKDMSRLARLEGIQTIYPDMPDIQEITNGIYSIRYSLESKEYVVCSIHRFLWDLTHVFSKIRGRKCTEETRKSEKLELSYYYPTKLVNDWVNDKLEVTDFGSSSTSETV